MREFALFVLALALSTAAFAADPLPAAIGDKTPFPTQEWTELPRDNIVHARLALMMGRAFYHQRPPALSRTRAMLVVVGGKIAAEQYAEGITKDTRLQSWSMAKSMLHATLGIAAADGKINPDAPAPVAEWTNAKDPRHAITIRHLMSMTDGLGFREDYGDPHSEVMQMLFGAGRGDVGKSAAATRFAHTPGAFWSYSSGSANILSRVLRDTLGGREAYARFLKERLFAPLGMTSAVAEFDASGSWIGSSYVHATARDFARFGLLYLRGGFWDGKQIIPREWTARACEPTAAADGRYGELFWLNRPGRDGKRAISDKLPEDMCFARGFGGQLVAIVPSHDTVIVMLNGAYTDETAPIIDLVREMLDAIARFGGS